MSIFALYHIINYICFRPARKSIGDEIKQLGVVDDTPLCEKSLNKPSSAKTLDLSSANHQSVAKSNQSVAKSDCASQTEEVVKEEEAKTVSAERPVDFKYVSCLSFALLLLGVFLFTFFGAMEFDSKIYYPITWSANLGLPEPLTTLKIVSGRTPEVW